MGRLVALLLIVVTQCVAKRNATDVPQFCEEYVNCLNRANKKSAECLEENATAIVQSPKKRCEGATELHFQLQALYDERNVEVEACVREKTDAAAVLSSRKVEKCKTALKKSKRSVNSDWDRRQKRRDKKDRKDKPKSCAKEAKKMRLQCAKIAKCCSVVKDCQDSAVQSKQITMKKKQLKKLYDVCRGADAKKKRANRKTVKDDSDRDKEKWIEKMDQNASYKQVKRRSRLNEKLEESLERKRLAPIQTKVLEELSPTEKV